MLVTACDGHTPTGPGSLTNTTVSPGATLPVHGTYRFMIEVTPSPATVEIDGTQLFTAVGLEQSLCVRGREVPSSSA